MSLSQPCASMLSMCLSRLTCFFSWLVVFRPNVCSVQDYWEGYKLFCYAFYSHSVQHEYEFQQSKLGSLLAYTNCFVSICRCCFALLMARILRCCCHFIKHPHCMVLYRATGLASPCPLSSYFPPYAPHNMHADPSSRGDVL